MAETNYRELWYEHWRPNAEKWGIPENGEMVRADWEAAIRDTFAGYLLAMYREQMAERYSGLPLNGVDPLVIRVIQIHHWAPEAAQSLDENGLILALADELAHFKLPEKAWRWAQGRLADLPYPESSNLIEAHVAK